MKPETLDKIPYIPDLALSDCQVFEPLKGVFERLSICI
jgi:hypothetical protein